MRSKVKSNSSHSRVLRWVRARKGRGERRLVAPQAVAIFDWPHAPGRVGPHHVTDFVSYSHRAGRPQAYETIPPTNNNRLASGGKDGAKPRIFASTLAELLRHQPYTTCRRGFHFRCFALG